MARMALLACSTSSPVRGSELKTVKDKVYRFIIHPWYKQMQFWEGSKPIEIQPLPHTYVVKAFKVQLYQTGLKFRRNFNCLQKLTSLGISSVSCLCAFSFLAFLAVVTNGSCKNSVLRPCYFICECVACPKMRACRILFRTSRTFTTSDLRCLR